MITYYLKADTEEIMINLLESVFKTDDDGLIKASHDYFIYIIGEFKGIEGCHVNIRVRDKSILESLSDVLIDVTNPLVKIAG